jgi:hypothetical protein
MWLNDQQRELVIEFVKMVPVSVDHHSCYDTGSAKPGSHLQKMMRVPGHG